ncbi:DUF6918 family protein [Nakamurella aerolata]|uniref:Uncharacterized protein n=1 Tax=Nakamurella aerolata TaxID=1656892 RepID=A0A849A7H4_9ACTN|nr:hypothetical protein [Nakamurella aerolata]NNG34450.1 hypothetical protein [Nakamurella aerolata]
MSLSATLLSDDRRSAVVADLGAVVEAEVKDKKGISGAAIKTGFAAARKVSPGLTDRALNRMLPDFAAALDPFWADFTSAGGGDFGSYLSGRKAEVSAALLAVTDKRVEGSSREAIKKAYRGMRGKAEDNVQAALPRLGAALQRHAG